MNTFEAVGYTISALFAVWIGIDFYRKGAYGWLAVHAIAQIGLFIWMLS